MPRYTPWNSGLQPERADPDTLIEEVLRPNLELAFPLPDDGDPVTKRFARLIDALSRHMPDERRHELHVAGQG